MKRIKTILNHFVFALKRQNVKANSDIGRMKTLLTVGLAKEFLEQLDVLKWQTHRPLWNPLIYVQFAHHDLSVLLDDLGVSLQEFHSSNSLVDQWRAHLYMRQVATYVYEMTEDIEMTFGRAYRESLRNLGLVPNELITELNSAHSVTSSFRKKYGKLLEEIRNNTSAHRDSDSLKFLEICLKTNITEIYQIGVEFFEHLFVLAKASQKILAATSTIKPPEL